MRQLQYQEEEVVGFDPRKVTIRDPKTGLIVKTNPYTLRIVGLDGGGKSRLLEMPKGSGNIFNMKMEPIGRWEKGEFVEGKEHIEFTPPETDDQKLAREVVESKSKIAELERELAQIRAESERKNKAANNGAEVKKA